MNINNPKRNRKTTRLQKWNYGWAGSYYITICTKNRVCYFGQIENQKMILSPVGLIADLFWHEIKNHAKNVELGPFVVMPNHVHGIITITRNLDGGDIVVGTGHALSLPSDTLSLKSPGPSRFQNPGKNTISSMVGGYKSAVSKHAHRLGFELEWQVRFWDNIIRGDAAWQRIALYIENNVKNWDDDGFNNQS